MINKYTIAGIIWILIAIYNFIRLPEDMKKKTNFISFFIFALLSPIVLGFTLFEIYILGKSQ